MESGYMSSWLRGFFSLEGKFFPARKEHSWEGTGWSPLKWRAQSRVSSCPGLRLPPSWKPPKDGGDGIFLLLLISGLHFCPLSSSLPYLTNSVLNLLILKYLKSLFPWLHPDWHCLFKFVFKSIGLQCTIGHSMYSSEPKRISHFKDRFRGIKCFLKIQIFF